MPLLILLKPFWKFIAAALLCGAFAWYTIHQQGVGEDRIKAQDAEIVAARKITNAEVERRAEVLAATQIGSLKAQLAAPPAADAPSLKCPRVRIADAARSPGTVPSDAGTGPPPNAATEQPTMVSRPIETIDYGPVIDKRFADDDALIAALQSRIAAEVGVCR